jgi:hypothetical protein
MTICNAYFHTIFVSIQDFEKPFLESQVSWVCRLENSCLSLEMSALQPTFIKKSDIAVKSNTIECKYLLDRHNVQLNRYNRSLHYFTWFTLFGFFKKKGPPQHIRIKTPSSDLHVIEFMSQVKYVYSMHNG